MGSLLDFTLSTADLPRTTCREPPLREPQGRELVEPAGRTTERHTRKCGMIVRDFPLWSGDPLLHRVE